MEPNQTVKNTDTIVIYDAEAVQRIPVGDGVCAVVKPYSDKRYLEYRDDFVKAVNEALKETKGATNAEEEEIKQALEKDCELCDALLDTLEGYEDLLADWKESISVEDKQAIIRKATNFVIDEDSEKFSLGKIVVPTACYFNGEVARQSHVLRRKSIDDSSRYALLKTKQFKVTPGKKLGEDNLVQVTPQDEAKSALYDAMRERVEGFANDNVPMRVKILVIDYIFPASIPGKK